MAMNLLIIGVGLIGGSLGLALKQSPLVENIMGFDENENTLHKALEIGAIDRAVDLLEGTSRADIIFLCTPLSTYHDILETIRPKLTPGKIVTDTGSTKEMVMHLFARLPQGVWGIGGHPMAGSEIKGIQGADRYLFENAVYGLTPGSATPETAVSTLVSLLDVSGTRIKIMDPALHDELVAAVSHIPHLAAVSLVNLTEGSSDYLTMAAGGFRDTTRIASSSPEIWDDILFYNQKPIVDKLNTFIFNLQNIKEALETNDADYIHRELCQAKEIRDKIPQASRGLIPGFHEIICIVPDRPGIIGQLGFFLGEEGINIVDIEILRAREGDGGTIRLGVPSIEDALKSVEILQTKNITAWVR